MSMLERLRDALRVDVSRETFEKVEAYATLLREESKRQNLISSSTLDHLWERHILDSAQLIRFEPHVGASWVDIGSGAGLPGMVLACLVEGPVTLIEPGASAPTFSTRRRRCCSCVSRWRAKRSSASAERTT